MAIADLSAWIDEHARRGSVWCAKRLAANDTLATNAHQAGPYIPKEFLFDVFPGLNRPDAENPDHRFSLSIDSHCEQRNVRAVWYNNHLRGGTRNEARLTGFGGRRSALLDPESTGALAVFAFEHDQETGADYCHVWVCHNINEEERFEDRLGPVEPKQFIVWSLDQLPVLQPAGERAPRSDCRLAPGKIPDAWIHKFPSGEEIIRKTMELRPPSRMGIDDRLIRRRLCEYELFQSVEEAVFLPKVKKGFTSLDTFLGLAQTILQSRKSRAGNSLEYHTREIMVEEGLRPGTDFSHRPVIEKGKRPDFLFPSQQAYEDTKFPAKRLRMLAAKTTCKDRWRQVLNEANRIKNKHLLTLQEGVSKGQFNEMREAGVTLVVPASLHKSYPAEVRWELVSLERFIGELRQLSLVSKAR